MNVVQVSVLDTDGARFNGQDLHLKLREQGIESTHLVWNKRGKDETTAEIGPANEEFKARIYRAIGKLERDLSLQSVLQPFAFNLRNEPFFKQADIAHFHLIHTGYFNLLALPGLTKEKPAVWTLHDPWALTGHCVHPFDCTRWKEGCGSCPALDSEFAMKRDNTRLMWNIKKYAYAKSNLDVIVCSKWMQTMVQESPLFKDARIHHIPLGLNLDVFKPKDSQAAKKKLGVRPGNLVVALRATDSIYKGLPHAIECLRMLKTNVSITILTFNQKGLLEEFFGQHQIIDLGWLTDESEIVTAYNATDIFLMPSEGESFGLMAVEAMACAKPTIFFDGTALTETTFSPEYGVCVPRHNTGALSAALKRLLENADERLERGRTGRKLAVENYDERTYLSAHVALYEDIFARRKKGARQNRDAKGRQVNAAETLVIGKS